MTINIATIILPSLSLDIDKDFYLGRLHNTSCGVYSQTLMQTERNLYLMRTPSFSLLQLD